MTKSELILGVDPGSSKSGVALLKADGTIENTEVLLMSNFTEALAEFLGQEDIAICILGNGTTSAQMQNILEQSLPRAVIKVVDEAHSTEEARTLYWEINPPKGLRKLFPLGMQQPTGNLDGLAAAVLVRRYLSQSTIQKTRN